MSSDAAIMLRLTDLVSVLAKVSKTRCNGDMADIQGALQLDFAKRANNT